MKRTITLTVAAIFCGMLLSPPLLAVDRPQGNGDPWGADKQVLEKCDRAHGNAHPWDELGRPDGDADPWNSDKQVPDRCERTEGDEHPWNESACLSGDDFPWHDKAVFSPGMSWWQMAILAVFGM